MSRPGDIPGRPIPRPGWYYGVVLAAPDFEGHPDLGPDLFSARPIYLFEFNRGRRGLVLDIPNQTWPGDAERRRTTCHGLCARCEGQSRSIYLCGGRRCIDRSRWRSLYTQRQFDMERILNHWQRLDRIGHGDFRRLAACPCDDWDLSRGRSTCHCDWSAIVG